MTDLWPIVHHYLAVLFLAVYAFAILFGLAFDFTEKLDTNPNHSLAFALAGAAVGLAGIVISIAAFSTFEVGEGLSLASGVLSLGALARLATCFIAIFYGTCINPDYRPRDSADRPLINVSELPAQIIAPVRAWLDDYLTTPLFERHVHLGWINFAIRIPPRRTISQNELNAVFERARKLAGRNEWVLRQQTTELEAQHARDLAQAHGAFLAGLTLTERGLLAARLRMRAEADAQPRNYQDLAERNNALTRQVESLDAERASLVTQNHHLLSANTALEQRVNDLVTENGDLGQQLGYLKIYQAGRDEIEAQLRRQVARENRHRQEREADLVTLINQNEALKEENERLNAHTRGQARSVSRLKASHDALTLQVKTLVTNNEELERTNAWLQAKLRFRGAEPPHVAHHQQSGMHNRA